MFDLIIQRLKSKTYRTALILTALTVIEAQSAFFTSFVSALTPNGPRV